MDEGSATNRMNSDMAEFATGEASIMTEVFHMIPPSFHVCAGILPVNGPRPGPFHIFSSSLTKHPSILHYIVLVIDSCF